MSSLATNSEAPPDEALEGLAFKDESLEEMSARHAKELKDMKAENRKRLKAAKSVQGKGQQDAIAEANACNLRAEDEVSYRHRGERDALEEAMDPDALEEAERAMTAAAAAAEAQEKATKAAKKKGGASGGGSGGTSAGSTSSGNEDGEGKKSKAQRKRDKERAKAREREERIAREKAGAGPSPREVELAIIAQKIGCGGGGAGGGQPAVPPLGVHEVLSDGHCLYRAVHHQLAAKLKPHALEQALRRGCGADGTDGGGGGGCDDDDAAAGGKEGFQALRELCASHMRGRPGDFLPFLDLDPVTLPTDGDDLLPAFSRYCDKVAQSADWGGQPELLALCHALRTPIRVHAADTPAPLLMGYEEHGQASGGIVLEITYHRHFYALGEHYNSTHPLG